MTTGGRSIFLVDADNVAVEVIEKALAMKQSLHGAIHVKRCYCSAEFAVKNLALLKQHSIRPMVNATAGKNCSDIALAIDAVQLCEREAPAVVVIVGSDSDFAPLVMHLRDRGCRVEGVGQEGKVGAESHLAYDDFISLPVGRGRAAKAPAARRAAPDKPRAGGGAGQGPAAGRAGRRRALARRGAGARVGRKGRAQGRRRGAAQGEAALPERVVDDAVQEASGLVRAGAGPAAELGALPPDFRAPMKSGPEGPLSLKATPLGAASLHDRRGGQEEGLTSGPRRRQPAPACRPCGRLRSAPCGRSRVLSEAVDGCVVPALPSPAGAILPDLASASVCALRSARVLSEAVDGCVVPALPSPAGASLPAFCASAVSALRCSRVRRGGRGLGEGGLREHSEGRDDGAEGEFGLH